MVTTNTDLRTKIIDNVTLSSITTLLLLVFFYDLFSSSYLPNNGTGIIFIIISCLSALFIMTNLFLGPTPIQNLTSILKSQTNLITSSLSTTGVSSFMENTKLYKLFTSAKLLMMVPLFVFLSYIFSKYSSIIDTHHTTLPNFDGFFTFIMFSLITQILYINGVHHDNKINQTIRQQVPPSIQSIIVFAIINVVNLMMVLGMWSNLKFSITDG